MTEISCYNPEDLREYYGIFVSAHPEERVSFGRFVKSTVLDRNFTRESFITASDGGKPVGFVYAPERVYAVSKNGNNDTCGYITLLSVKPGLSVADIGGCLLEAAEALQKKRCRTFLSTGYSPVYINQGCNAKETDYLELFRGRGYKESVSASRIMKLSGRKKQDLSVLREKLGSEGYYIGPLEPEIADEYLSEDAPFSGSGWAWEFRSRLEQTLDWNSVHVAVKDGHIVGACVFGDPMSDNERFGPFGVGEKHQGRGIGKILLNDTLDEMERRGLQCAWMQWTPVSGSADALYGKFGFTVAGTYYTFKKEL